MKERDKIFIRGLIGVAGATVLSYAIFTPAILFASPPIAKAFALGVPPMIIIACSWIVGCWWVFNKGFALFTGATAGLIPVRIAVYCAWCLFVHKFIPEASIAAMVLSSIAHWIIFMSVEVWVFVAYSKLRKCTQQVETPEAPREPPKVARDGKRYKHLLPNPRTATRERIKYRV